MAYPTSQEITDKAAAKGFRVGAYVHMNTRTADTAAPIREFSSMNGVVQVVWMNGACCNLLGELRLSSQHRLRYQFPAGYDFLASPQLVAEAIRQAGSTADAGAYTAARVKGYGSAGADTWVTTDPAPESEGAVYLSLRPQPAPDPFAELSPNMEYIVAAQPITAADVAHWMETSPKQGAKMLKDMQNLYGERPAFVHLGLYSAATTFAAMVGSVTQARRRASGEES